jgi:hypothetical protein
VDAGREQVAISENTGRDRPGFTPRRQRLQQVATVFGRGTPSTVGGCVLPPSCGTASRTGADRAPPWLLDGPLLAAGIAAVVYLLVLLRTRRLTAGRLVWAGAIYSAFAVALAVIS